MQATTSLVTQDRLPKINFEKNLGAKKCVIFAHMLNGYGDISCGFRLAANLIERVNIAKDNIVIATNNPEAQHLFNKHQFKVVDYTELKNIRDVALQIIAPASLGFVHGGHMISRQPTLQLWEYGYDNRSPDMMSSADAVVLSKSMGLNRDKGEIGIWIDPELFVWSHSQESQTLAARAKKLENLNETVRKLILGDGKASEQAQKFIQSSKLYVGYTSKDVLIAPFLHAIASMNADDTKDLTVMVPGNRLLERIDSPKLQEVLAKQKIGSICLKYYRQGKSIEEREHKLSDAPKKMTFICGVVPNEDMRLLWMASEKEVLATGDQSLSEAISANKSIVYEALYHKIGLGHSLINHFAPKGVATLREGEAEDFEYAGQTMLATYSENKKDGYRTLTQANRSIAEKQDCLPAVAALMQQAMEIDTSTLKQIIDYRDNPGSFVPANIPFNVNCYVNLSQVQQLRIDVDSGKSDLNVLTDSVFDAKWIGPDCYGICRKKA